MLLPRFLNALTTLPQCSYHTSAIYKKNKKVATFLSNLRPNVSFCNWLLMYIYKISNASPKPKLVPANKKAGHAGFWKMHHVGAEDALRLRWTPRRSIPFFEC